MADDKSDRGPADRARINIHEAYEVEYWSEELGVTPRNVSWELVAKHGSSRRMFVGLSESDGWCQAHLPSNS
jgi:Protein of unknown function (DUF3606)